MNQNTDHIVASLLDDLEEKNQEVVVSERLSIDENESVDEVDLSSFQPKPPTRISTEKDETQYVNIDIETKPEEQPSEKKVFSLLFSRLKTNDNKNKVDAADSVASNPDNLPISSQTISKSEEALSAEVRTSSSPELGSYSKTRLPSLPPKDPAEERKHLAQFQAMMAAAKQREAAKAAEADRLKAQKEQLAHQLTQQWHDDLLPRWGTSGWEARAKKAVCHGIPPACREEVWQRSLLAPGKASPLNQDTYKFLLERARYPPAPYLAMTVRNAKLIALDAAGVFPDLGLFSLGHGGDLGAGDEIEAGPLHKPLMNVLGAHAALAPTELYGGRAVGPMAGVLLLHMDETKAFLCLQGLLSRPLQSAFALSTPQAPAYLKAFDMAFASFLPRLYKHFQLAQLRTEMFLNHWIGNLFAKHLNLEVCCYVWDRYLVGGVASEDLLFNVALIMLGFLEPHLYGRLDEALTTLSELVPISLDYLGSRLPGGYPNGQNTKESYNLAVTLPSETCAALKTLRETYLELAR